MKSVQSYQIFGMATDNPGVVSCRAGPNSEVVTQDLRRSFDSIPTSDEKVRDLFESHLGPLQPPLPNFEKKQQMFNKVRMYVPDEFRSDPIYDAPNDEQEQKANEAKKARRKASAKKKKVTTTAAEAKETASVPAGEQESEVAGPKQAKQPRKRARKEQ
ncbi:hypothetical protein PF010_g31965 [Phytophthora fragariae]|nr:hypothetical protein PF010_g31965 [Phytophthora fragariae]KAE9056601.1 hypothetical protein PF007_g31937 [Phytophthora fragariae]KAE9057879.1 hypothetical protein PF006_g32303 [Phytophthora fragariae]KAE9158874.1 hypothetical protein PF004_g31735 [Phytophthora fragariae]KAE9264701.1 hypothetical protein PF008_g32052 [Phytophthora fragariae]